MIRGNELPLEKVIENINLNSLSTIEKIYMVLKSLIKTLGELKANNEITISDEEHWIYSSLEEMIENDENYDQNEIKILKSTGTLTVKNDFF